MPGRDQRLLDLKNRVDEWAERERQRLEDEVAFLESVRDGQSGSGSLAAQVVESAGTLLQEEIDAFLTE